MENILPIRNLHKLFIQKYKDSVRINKKILVNSRLPLNFKIQSRDSLLHYRINYNYCHCNLKWNWGGVGHRQCKANTREISEMENCLNLCCGFGHISIPKQKQLCQTFLAPTFHRTCIITKEVFYYCKYENETTKKRRHKI